MKNVAILLFLCLFITRLFSQPVTPPFRKEVDALKKKDSIEKPAPHSILFTGSSSFTKWTDVQDYFPGYPILNRAFGGSSLTDLIRYADEIILPYHPKQIILYCGENDIAASDTVTAKTVLSRFQALHGMIRKKLPRVPIVFVSIKPSPSRWKFEPVIVEANRLIHNFIKTRPGTRFVNIHNAMLQPDGSVMTEIFTSDSLHMNKKGYAIWAPILRKALIRSQN